MTKENVHVVGYTANGLILTGTSELSAGLNRVHEPNIDLINLLVRTGNLTQHHADLYLEWVAKYAHADSTEKQVEDLYTWIKGGDLYHTDAEGYEFKLNHSPEDTASKMSHTEEDAACARTSTPGERFDQYGLFAIGTPDKCFSVKGDPLFKRSDIPEYDFTEVMDRTFGKMAVQATNIGQRVRSGELTLKQGQDKLNLVCKTYGFEPTHIQGQALEELFLNSINNDAFLDEVVLAVTTEAVDALKTSVKNTVQKTTSMEELRARLCSNNDCNHAVSVVGENLDIFSAATFLDEARVTDVLRALPMINRYTGQTLHPYSVAQHSMVLTSWACREAKIVEPHLLMAILLHDAAEAFIGDIIRPVKRMVKGDIRELEANILTRLYATVIVDPVMLNEALDPGFQDWLHQNDTALAKTEALSLQRHDILPHYEPLAVKPDSFDYIAWPRMTKLFKTAFSALRSATVYGVGDATKVIEENFNFNE